MVEIRPFRSEDEAQVVALWGAAGLVRPWNDPYKDIRRKLTVQPDLFLVAVDDGRLIGSVMAGFDGHRGWANYLAVAPDRRGEGTGRLLMERVEAELLAMGCPKINVQIRTTNAAAIDFYHSIGFRTDSVIGMGKRLEED